MNRTLILLLGVMMMSVFFIPQASAGWCDWFPFWFCDDGPSNTLEYGNKWVLDYTTDDDYFLWMEDPKNKKTEVCLLHKTATKLGDLPNSMPLYKYDGELLADLNRKKQTLGDKDWYGFCRKLDNDDVEWLKFNNHSTVLIYENNTLSAIDDNNNTIQDVILYENEECLVDCYASGRAVIYNESALFEGFDFVDMNNNTINLSNSYILIQNDTWYNETVKVWTYNCSNVTAPNSTVVEQCDSNYTLANKSVHDNSYYVYNPNTVLPVGSYNWRLEADKGRQNLDWAFSFQGFGTEEVREYWAWWNSSWDYKKEITGIIGEYPTFNVTYDADMNTNFSDIRFLDSSETVELNHTLRVKNDGVNATFTVDVNGNTTIYMYFGNPSAQSTSNANATFNEPVFMVTWDDGITDLITNTTGTPVNGPVVQNGIIGSAYNCSSALSQYFNFGDVAKMSAGSDMTLFGIFRVGDISGVDYVIGKDGIAPRGWAFGYASSGVPNTNFYTFETGGAGSPDSYAFDTLDFNWYYSTWRFDDATNSIDTWLNGTSNNNNSFLASVNDVSYDTYICQRSYPGSPQQYDGIVDDMILYDRALSDDEIADLNSMSFQEVTFGAKESVGGLTISLLTPENFYETANPVVDFECSCVPGFGQSCTTLNMTIDGSEVNSTQGTGSLNLTYTASFDDGNYNWTCFAQNSTGAILYAEENRTFFIDSAEPFVNITSPPNATIIYDFQENITVNWTIFDINGTLDSCWYELDNDSLESNNIGSATSVSLTAGTKAYYFNNDSFGGSFGDITFNYDFSGFHSLNDGVLNNIASWSNAGSDLNCVTQTYDNSTVSFPANIGNEVCVLLINGTYTKINITGNSTFDWYYQEIKQPQYPLTCNDNTTVISYPATTPDSLLITLYANDTLTNEGNDSVTILKSTTPPQINITSPLVQYAALENNSLLDLNFTVSTLGTIDTCIFEYNGVNTTIAGCIDTQFNYVEDINNVTVYANDTLGNLNSTTRSWTVLAIIGDETFNNETLDTKTENFTLEVFISPDVNSVTGSLVYDGVSYPTSPATVGNITSLTASIDIPVVENDENVSFYFEVNTSTISAGTSIVDTDPQVQLVRAINLSLCDATNNVSFINYTTYVSRTPFPQVNTTFKSTWQYHLSSGSGGVEKDFSYEDLVEDHSEYEFCFNFAEETIDVTNAVEVDATNFTRANNFLIDAELSNDTTAQKLYLLNDSLATAIVLEVIDYNLFPIPNVTIDVQFYDLGSNSYITVTQAQTGTAGTDVVYLNLLDSTYQFILKRNNQVILSTLPEVLFETIRTFTIGIDFSFDYDRFQGIDYSLNYDENSSSFLLSFVKPSGAFTEGCLRVNKKSASSTIEICNICETSSSATLVCSIAGFGNGTYLATFYGAFNPNQSLAWIYENIGDPYSRQIAETIGDEDALFYAFLMGLLMVSVMFFSPIGGIIAIMIGVFVSSLMGFILIDYITMVSIAFVGGLMIWLIRR